MQLTSDDAQIFYQVQGNGPTLVLLHPYPTIHRFWQPLAARLAEDYRLLMPDLRAHGASSPGTGPATMEKHAADLVRLCDQEGIKQAIFFGVSIGGYILFEFWRRNRERIRALVLSDTKAQSDSPEARTSRLNLASEVENKGPDDYLDSMIQKLLGESTRRNRPDVVKQAREMMGEMKVAGIAAALRGMAVRADSVSTLSSINVPVLAMVGEEDTLTPSSDTELIHKGIKGSQFARVPAAGHYAPFEQPAAVLDSVLGFLQKLPAAWSG